MKNNYINIFIACLFFLLAIPSKGQHFLSTNGKAIVNENQDTILLRGMGLGGWMLQEGYMLQTASFANAQYKIRNEIEALIGTEDTDLFYEAWLANHVRKADIDSLKKWGFNSVRLPMHYNLFTLPIEDEPIAGQNTWLTKGFVLTDSLISWCKQNEMYVILDLHAAPGGQGQDEGISDYDTSKPSLWESQANRDKMVALWANLAERYADEQWVAGYDLLNEPNWNLPGNVALKTLYQDVTTAIRAVDSRHIIFIEGNWFANDFTNLTPPWDDNLVYSPHKYWSINDQASIQWVLDIRENYNVPLYLGESGENSNVWFRDAIRLFEDNDIGWAWWPMKKIESIAGPLSVTKTPAYQSLLNYWEGNGATPSAAFAKATLMEITELLKIENCTFQKDVIDAMFRQVYSDETIPYNTQDIPGVVFATDFDMGVIGEAYYDIESGNYAVSTGNYTSWNNGWAYRNDGVDIEACADNVNTNRYNVAWLDTDEWMQYDVNVTSSAVYDVNVRVASGTSGGHFHFETDGAAISIPYYVPNTGGWQTWQTLTIPDVILDTSDEKLRLVVDGSGFNVSSFEFVEKGSSTSVPAEFIAAETVDPQTIKMNTNKFLVDPLPVSPANFEIFVNNSSIPISDVTLDPNNARIVYFTVDYTMRSTETIRMSYNGTQINATDGTDLDDFFMKNVKNNLSSLHIIPGKIEAEDFYEQSGIQLENTTDTGGGQNIGFLDPGDYLDYEVDVLNTGIYRVDYRTASESATGAIQMLLVNEDGSTTLLHAPSFPSTGGWQSWTTTSEDLTLTAGIHKLRMVITQSPFNMNWFEFSLTTTATSELSSLKDIKIFPNPTSSNFYIESKIEEAQDAQIEVRNINGQIVYNKHLVNVPEIQEEISLVNLPSGYYAIVIRLADGSLYSDKLIKM